MKVVKTIKEAKVGKSTIRLVQTDQGYAGIAFNNKGRQSTVEGTDPDDVWNRLHNEVAKSSPSFVGFQGAKNRFLKIFPKGFKSEEYLNRERNYKVAAKTKLDKAAPFDAAETGKGFGEAALSAFRATNMLSPFEKTRLTDALRGPHADAFVQGAAIFAKGDVERGLAKMEAALKLHDVAKWTAVTYLPYLWLPSMHMFLKPEVTNKFAERVGHTFTQNYSTKLDPKVYLSLRSLTEDTAEAINDLEPQDSIDVQSFIWVVGEYGIDEKANVTR